MRPVKASNPRRVEAAVFGAVLAGLVLTAYRPALTAGRVWDDEAVFENPLVREPGGIFSIWLRPWLNLQEEHYWPMTYSSFWLEWRVFGERTWFYHLNNILLHAANGFLLHLLLLRRKGMAIAWVAPLVFVLHPVAVESTAWIIERKNTLNLFFALASLNVMAGRGGAAVRSAGTLLLFAFSVLSKSTTAVLPFVVLGVGAAVPAWRARLRANLGLQVAGGAALIAVVLVGMDLLHVRMAGRVSGDPHFMLSPADRAQIALRTIPFYLGKLMWPSATYALYPQWTGGWGLLLGGAALAGCARLLARRNFHAWMLLSFLALIAPTSGIVQFSYLRLSHAADRFCYAASIPVVLIACGVVAQIHGRTRRPRLAAVFVILVLGALVCVTLGYARAYRDNEALFSRTVRFNPDSWSARFNLGNELAARKALEEALVHYEAAARLAPDESSVHHNLGNTLARLGRFSEALPHYDRALALDPGNERAIRNATACATAAGDGERRKQYAEMAQRRAGSAGTVP